MSCGGAESTSQKAGATMGINVKHLLDRPCSVCEFHKENGCCKWSCVFEQEPIIDKIREEIKGFSKYYLETEKVLEIIDEYRSERI